MRQRVILPNSEEVTLFTPVANYRSPVLKMKTPVGTAYGMENPFQLIAKLYTSGGVQIPANSNLFVALKTPRQDYERYLRKIPYAAYYDLSEGNQRDVRFNNSTLHVLDVSDSMVRVPEDFEIQFWLESSVVADLTHANTRFEFSVLEDN